ncbi:MAG TPA: hypothetical protein VFQ88_08870, partial [Nevskiaceae bacterium]|nr:hypothetical protein [Nevskiaceae bacterium]
VRKGALLARDAEATSALYAPETLSPCTPEPSQLDLARRALDALPFATPLLYARVDLIRADDGSPRLLELELVEPSVFLGYAEGAAARFAAAILERVGAHSADQHSL